MKKSMEKSVLLNWIAAGLGIVAVIMLFLPFIGYSKEVLGKTVSDWANGFTVTFGGDLGEVEYFGFSFMNLLTVLLLLAGVALSVLAALKGNKMMAYVAAACLLLAGIFFFCGNSFWVFSSENTKGLNEELVDALYQDAREGLGLGAGAIIAGICSILAAVSAAGSTVIDKLLKK
ncbi:MAG: hypothetical protein IJ506_00010 [Clostridia bacterium]|nr:hypothetical protein [Clostridia bacterium]